MFLRWLDLKKSKKSILLLGPRRSGKSTYLKSTFSDYKYVTLDDLDHLADSQKDPKNWIERLGSKFIIDEAQRNPQLSIALKWAIDEKKVHFILTGSTGINLLEKTTETLAGRIQIYYMTPSCFGEVTGPYLENTDFDKESEVEKLAKRQLEPFLKSGGFPEIVTAQEEEQAELLNIYKNSYFTRDLAFVNNIENLEGLRALYAALIRGIQSRYEVSSLANETGMSVITVKKYLNTLIQSGLLFKLYGYHHGTAKRYISSSKSYFIDIGILQALSKEFSRAQLIECFVISEIEKRRRLGIYKCDELYYYESVGGHEIDLIIEEADVLTVIEIKSSVKVSGRDLKNIKSFSPDTKKQIKKIIYYCGNKIYFTEENIEIRPIWALFGNKY